MGGKKRIIKVPKFCLFLDCGMEYMDVGCPSYASSLCISVFPASISFIAHIHKGERERG